MKFFTFHDGSDCPKCPSTKALLVMNLTAIFLVAASLQVSAKAFSQKVTIDVKETSLETVFKQIEKQTSYTFLYNAAWMGDTHKVTISAKDEDLETVLNRCFQDQPVSYTIIEKTIMLKQKQLKSSDQIVDPAIGIHGRVTDSVGNPLAGASVYIKGSGQGTETDANGYFTLKGNKQHSILTVSFTGYTTREFKVNEKSDFSIRLTRSLDPLDQVQVIAYGTTTQRLSTGNISTIKSDDIEKQPVDNPLFALEGRVPGLVITQSNGLPGSGATVRVQGQNSILGGNDPLYVVDGIPYLSQMLATTNGGPYGVLGGSGSSAYYQAGGNGNPMSYINPSDIESISILKDADATSIYGSRAANGAILITTKKGKSGPPKYSADMQQGIGQVGRYVKMMNTSQYLQMRHEALNNDGLSIDPIFDYDLNGLWDTTRNTNWAKALIGTTSHYTNINSSVSGGTENSHYLFAATYHRQSSVFPTTIKDFSDEKGSVHFAMDNSSKDQKFTFQFSATYLLDNNELPQQDFSGIAYLLAPDAPPLFDKSGNLNWVPNAIGNSSWTNPIAQSYNNYQNHTDNLMGNAFLGYKFLSGFEISSRFGFTKLETNELSPNSILSIPPESRSSFIRSAEYSNSTIKTFLIEPELSYKRLVGTSRVDAFIGTTIQQNNSSGQTTMGNGYLTDYAMTNPGSAASLVTLSSVQSVYKYNALFGKISYNLHDEFLVNLAGRRDGSSHFGPANRFHNFGSASAAWIFSKESIFDHANSVLSFGKVTASFGTSGNDQIGDYTYLDLYATNNPAVPYQGATGSIIPVAIPNPNIQWEETRKLSIGLDLGFFQDRALLTAIFGHNRSSNQLLQYSLPIITGFHNVNSNFPATVQNNDFEITLSTKNIKTNNFSWNTHFNITIPSNKLVSFPNLSSSTYANQLVVGQPLSAVKTFHFLGVDPQTGVYKFSSKSDPYNPVYPDDATVLKNIDPKIYGGLQNEFRYKHFALDFLLQFMKHNGINYFAFGNPDLPPGSANVNQPTAVLNRWRKPGDEAPFQRYNSDFSLYNQWASTVLSDASYGDASFIKLKNLSLSYDFQSSVLKRAHISELRLFILGQNLYTLTKFKGIDPETLSDGLPPLRMWTAGIHLSM